MHKHKRDAELNQCILHFTKTENYKLCTGQASSLPLATEVLAATGAVTGSCFTTQKATPYNTLVQQMSNTGHNLPCQHGQCQEEWRISETLGKCMSIPGRQAAGGKGGDSSLELSANPCGALAKFLNQKQSLV